MLRRSFYRGSLCGAALLGAELLWFALDPKGDTRQHLVDHGVRLLERVGSVVKI